MSDQMTDGDAVETETTAAVEDDAATTEEGATTGRPSKVQRLEAEGVAWDVGAYRDAPPGLRVWCGATVELRDVQAMLPWLDWAFHAEVEVAQAA